MGHDPKNRRVRVPDGTLTLKQPELPDLVCGLIEVDEDGCRAKITAGTISLETATAWHHKLVPDTKVHLNVESREPVLKLNASAVVQHLLEFSNHLEVEFRFDQLSPAHKSAIGRARFSSALQDFDLPAAPPTASGAQSAAPGPGLAQMQTLITPMPAAAVALPLKHVADPTTEFLRNKKIGEVLIHMGHLTPEQAEDAAACAAQMNEQMGRFLLRFNMVTPAVLCHALALQSGLPIVDLSALVVSEEMARRFPYTVLKQEQFVPFEESDASISIAVTSPLKPKSLEELGEANGKRIRQFLAEEDKVLKFLDQIHEQHRPRKEDRHPLSVPVRYQFCNRVGAAAEETVYFVRSLNISQSGLAVEGVPGLMTASPDVRNQELYANVLISAPGGGVHAIYRLRWVRRGDRKVNNAAYWQIGMELVEIAEADRARLKDVCQSAPRGKRS